MDASEILFDKSAVLRPVTMIVEAKGSANSVANILTQDSFQEMIDWEHVLFNVKSYDDA